MKKMLRRAAVAAMLLLALPAVAQKDLSKAMIVKGSDTMVNLSAAWSQAFMKANPGKVIAVNGGGSGVGIAALLNGATDICNASRDIKPEEKKKAVDNGISPVETNVALDGIAIVVNPANPLKEITLAQLKDIYTGAKTNWKDFGGSDEQIMVYSRETSSGTYVFFQEHVLQLEDYATDARLMPATGAIIEAVSSDKGAIGYVGLGYAAKAADRVKLLPVKKDANAPAIEPTEETVRSGTYSISRPLHCYTNGKPKGDVKAFLDFCMGDAGQAIVREQGYVPLR